MIGKLTINVCPQQGQSGQTTTISIEEIQKVVKENMLNFLEKGNFQGTAQDLDDKIELINTILQSDDQTLDSLKEIVSYIKQNKEDLQTLSVENIAGLQEALDEKVNVGSGSTSTGSGTDKHIVRFEKEENYTIGNYNGSSDIRTILKIKAIFNDDTSLYLPDIIIPEKELGVIAREYENKIGTYYNYGVHYNDDFQSLIGNMFLNLLENNPDFKEMVKQRLEF